MVLFQKIERIGNDNDDHARNIGWPRAEVAEAKVEVVEQVIKQRTRIAGQAGLRRISIHRFILHSLPLFSHTIQNRQLHSAAVINACRWDDADCYAAAAGWWRTRCVESLVLDKE